MPEGSEWWKHSWNWMHGCTQVSDGCKFCYAKKMAHRLQGRVGYPPKPDQFSVVIEEGKILAPLDRKKPTVYFAPSMGDPFHRDVPDAVLRRVLAVIAACPQHTFIILTKRIQRARDFLNSLVDQEREMREQYGDVLGICMHCGGLGSWSAGLREEQPCSHSCGERMRRIRFPLPNLWLGTSAENAATLNERGRFLNDTEVAHRVLSLEPLLREIEPVILAHALFPKINVRGVRTVGHPGDSEFRQAPSIDWVLVGGETGSLRPIEPGWVRSIREVCGAAGVPMWFKQWGNGKAPDGEGKDTLDGKRIREVPVGPASLMGQ